MLGQAGLVAAGLATFICTVAAARVGAHHSATRGELADRRAAMLDALRS